MITVESLYSVHQRFARYYLNRLNDLASKLDTKDDTSFIESIALLDEDLAQIRQAIGSLNTLASQDSELALIALNILKTDTRLLMLRFTSDELLNCTKTALEAAQRFEDEQMVRRCLYQLAMVYRDTARYEESIAYLQELLVLSRESADRHSEARALFLLGSIDRVLGHPVQGRQKLETGLGLLKEIDDRSSIYGSLLLTLATTYSSENKYEIAIPLQQEALALFREQRDLFRMCYSLNNLGNDYMGLRRYSEALTIFEEGIQIARSIGHNDTLNSLLGNTGYIELRLGHIDTAQTYLEESIMASNAVDDVYTQLLFSSFLFHITMTAQNLSESNGELCDLIAKASESKIIGVVLLLLTGVARWHLLAGDPVRSLQLLDFVSMCPEAEHECVYFVERVRQEVADSYPNLQSAMPLEQTLDDIIAIILAACN